MVLVGIMLLFIFAVLAIVGIIYKSVEQVKNDFLDEVLENGDITLEVYKKYKFKK